MKTKRIILLVLALCCAAVGSLLSAYAEDPTCPSHTPDTARYYMNTESHWRICQTCSDIMDETPHQYQSFCDLYCIDCGFVRIAPHNPTDIIGIDDDQVHQATCADCGILFTTPHTYDNACDIDCNGCGHIRNTQHTFVWSYTHEQHWILCLTCGLEQEAVAHILVDGVCECGFTADDPVPDEEHEHHLIWNAGQEATCTEEGIKPHYVCEECTQIFEEETASTPLTSDQLIIPPTEHTPVEGEHIAPTCTESGSDGGLICSACGLVLVEPTSVDPTGHTEVEVYGYDPSCTSDGLSSGLKCANCDLIILPQEIIPALGHKERPMEDRNPTCTTEGLMGGTQCESCGIVLDPPTSIPANDHLFTAWEVFAEPQVGVEGLVVRSCEWCGATERATIPALDPEETDAPPMEEEPTETEPEIIQPDEHEKPRNKKAAGTIVIIIGVSIAAIGGVIGYLYISRRPYF